MESILFTINNILVKECYCQNAVVITAYSYTKKSQLNLVMIYPKKMTPAVTVLDLSIDNRVRKCWGDEIVKLSFSSTAKAPVKGQYEFRIKPFKN